MVFVRTITAALIAFWVTVLPATGEAIVLLSNQPAVASEPDMPCCPSCDTQGDAKLAVCALKCATLLGVVFSAAAMVPLHTGDRPSPIFNEQQLREFVKAPPTHPPQL